MKKFFLPLCLFLSLCAHAQSFEPKAVFGNPKPQYFQDKVEEIYTGQPIIKISRPNNQKQKEKLPTLKVASQKELENSSLPLNLIYTVKTPFGIEKTAGNIDHTTDFNTQIQLIDKKSISVKEYIQIITTKPTKIDRTLSLLSDNGSNIDVELISFEINSKKVSYSINKEKNTFSILAKNTYEPGVYFITLQYILRNAVQYKDGVTKLLFSVTGGQWPYPINRFQAVILYPYIPIVYQKQLYFGANNIHLPAGYKHVSDIKGNSIYTLTRPLPAFADVRILETFDGNQLPINFKDMFLEKYKLFLFSIGSVLALCIYLISSNYYLKKIEKKKRNTLKEVNNLPLSVLLSIQKKQPTFEMISNLIKIKKMKKKKAPILLLLLQFTKLKFSQMVLSWWLYLYNLIYMLFKHIIISVFIFIIFIAPLYMQEDRSITTGLAVAFVFICALIIFYYKAIIPVLKDELEAFKTRLLSPYICFGLKNKTVLNFYLRYYRTAFLLNCHQELHDLIKNQTTDLDLPTI